MDIEDGSMEQVVQTMNKLKLCQGNFLCSCKCTRKHAVHWWMFVTMNRENRLLVTDEPVEVQDFRKITNPFGGIYRTSHNLIKKNQKMSKCNQLILETLGSCLIMSKNLPGY